MKISFALWLIFLIGISLGCGRNTDQGQNPLLIEANQIHQKSLDIREEILPIEEELKNLPQTNEKIWEALRIWDKDIIEVPGFEHSHGDENNDHGDHSHHRKYHVHNPLKPMEPEQHLQYQIMMYEEIKVIFSEMEDEIKKQKKDE
ncbi:hypothetical protein [Pararhodonellum marinum]|uniref:hypothetical protein n=1 Tax=Pararhodonellum marinum TaxID=2755358 RepID=UPI0018906818|nr:hypothetical protein [Pararhodonellum marinum]